MFQQFPQCHRWDWRHYLVLLLGRYGLKGIPQRAFPYRYSKRLDPCTANARIASCDVIGAEVSALSYHAFDFGHVAN